MIVYYEEPKNRNLLEEFAESISKKFYYFAPDYDELYEDELEDIKNGDALQANDSGSFSDVFFIDDLAVKMHSRFDDSLEGNLFEFGYTSADGAYDYEVLKTLKDNPFTPKLYASMEINYTHASVVENVKGESLRDFSASKEVDFSALKKFLLDAHIFFFEEGWIPLDLSPTNIFVTKDGSFKLIDFSCFHSKEQLKNASESMINDINTVKASNKALEKHIDKILDAIRFNLSFWSKKVA